MHIQDILLLTFYVFSDLQSIAFTHTNGVALGMAMSVSWSKPLVQTDISATTGWIAMNIVDPLTMVRLHSETDICGFRWININFGTDVYIPHGGE